MFVFTSKKNFCLINFHWYIFIWRYNNLLFVNISIGYMVVAWTKPRKGWKLLKKNLFTVFCLLFCNKMNKYHQMCSFSMKLDRNITSISIWNEGNIVNFNHTHTHVKLNTFEKKKNNWTCSNLDFFFFKWTEFSERICDFVSVVSGFVVNWSIDTWNMHVHINSHQTLCFVLYISVLYIYICDKM